MRDENQLHAANVELVALDDAEIKYSTVQNWYPGDKDGKGGIYTNEPSVKTAEFKVAKKWSVKGITDPKYFLTRSGCF